jgi:hypothetical protein
LLQEYGVIPPPPQDKRASWGERVWGAALELQRQVFCNRSLNMKQISVRPQQCAAPRRAACDPTDPTILAGDPTATTGLRCLPPQPA